MALTIQSPGVEIREIDLSTRAELPGGTTVFATGFTNQGPIDEVLNIGTVSEFEQVYGKPTNDAEKYLHHNVKTILSGNANLIVSRIPYDEDSTNKYSALFYPIVSFTNPAADGDSNMLEFAEAIGEACHDSNSLSEADTHLIGKPWHLDITDVEYQKIINGDIEWSEKISEAHKSMFDASLPLTFDQISKVSGIIIVNDKKLVLNNKQEGYYIGLVDNTNLNPATDFNSVVSVNAFDGTDRGNMYTTVKTDRMNFALSADKAKGPNGSISEILENLTEYDVSGDDFNDSLGIAVFKIRQSVTNPDTNKLDAVLVERYFGSLNYQKEQFLPQGGDPASAFIESEVEASPYFKLFVNPNLSKSSAKWKDHSRVRIINDEATNRNLATSGALSEIDTNLLKAFNRVSTGIDPFPCPSTTPSVTPSVTPDISKTPSPSVTPSVSVTKSTGVPSPTPSPSFTPYATSSLAAAFGANKLFAHGVYKDSLGSHTKKIKNVADKLNRIFELADNWELFPIDIVVDAGVSTIAANATIDGDTYNSDKYIDLNGGGLYSTKHGAALNGDCDDAVAMYKDICNTFIDFAQSKRKDVFAILDPFKNIFVNGNTNKILDDKSKNFSQHVYWPLRHTTGVFNTNYAAIYSSWGRTYDSKANKQNWFPISGTLAAMHSNNQPWQSAAGYERGILPGYNDIAFYPTQKQRDLLYKINVNPIANSPGDGFVILGAKTLQAKPSSFDRIITRRTFLYLEKATRATMKYFVFRPNTLLTRTQVVNVLTPIFDQVAKADGLYEFLIVCDTRNNTPDVLDRNEMVVDIYLKAVREAEKILINFYSTRVGQDFSELIA